MTPFIYYHFLTLRYTSRRNPYTRNMFHELRLATEAAVPEDSRGFEGVPQVHPARRPALRQR